MEKKRAQAYQWCRFVSVEEHVRRVLVLINPKSGLPRSFLATRLALDRFWDQPGTELIYQFSQSQEDGIAKARRAVEQGFGTILVSGGAGTVSTISRELVNTDVSVGIIPAGSGNGFARHFGIPLSLGRAVAALANATVQKIDVGVVNGLPFFVTCSMAWDAALVQSFERSPVRGIVPYVFAGVQGLLEYRPQDMDVEILDAPETFHLRKPMIFTIANLTQYGGGAIIAPDAKPDDGKLELVVGLQQDAAVLLANLARLFSGSLNRIPHIKTRSFESMTVRREDPTQIQVDGELIDAPQEINISVIPHGLNVLVPNTAE